MTPKAGRYVVGAAAGLAIAVSLTACKDAGQDTASSAAKPAGGGVRLTAAQEAMAKAASQTDALTSFRGTMSFSTATDGRRFEMKGKLAFRREPVPAMRLDIQSADVGGQETRGVTEVLTGDRLYLKGPGIGTGKPWVSIPISRLSGSSGVNAGLMAQGDPSLNTKMFTASKDVRVLGKETLGGVPTTHYQGTFALRDGLWKLGNGQRAQVRQSFGKAGLATMDFDLWVDGRQRPRKMIQASPPGAVPATKTTMTYSAFDVPVTITAPPKSQVADGSAFLGGRANVPG